MRVLLFVFKPLTTVLIIVHAWPRGADTPRRAPLRAGAGWCCRWSATSLLLWPQRGLSCRAGRISAGAPRLHRGVHARACGFSAQPAALAGLRAGRRRDPGAAVGRRAAGVAHAGGGLRAGAHRDGGADGGGGPGSRTATTRRRARLPDARRRAVHGLRRAAGDQQVSRCALPAADLWILGTYWAAQWCIASWLSPAHA